MQTVYTLNIMAIKMEDNKAFALSSYRSTFPFPVNYILTAQHGNPMCIGKGILWISYLEDLGNEC